MTTLEPPDRATPVLIVYGAAWCEDTRRARRLLRRLGVVHRYRDVDEDLEAMERAATLNHGVRRTPVITLQGDVLVEPSNATLTRTLIRHGLLTREVAIERLHVQNVGDLERCVRVSVGLLMLALGRQTPRALRGALGVTGTGLLLTGMSGWCPVFHARGVSSLNGPGDRPDEAERATWLTTSRNGAVVTDPTAEPDRDRNGSRFATPPPTAGPRSSGGAGPRLTLIEPDRPR